MSVINVKCVDQTLTITNAPLIASGDVQTDTVKFDFCPLWDGLVKTAVFYRNEKDAYSVVVDRNTDECVIPKEVLIDEGCFFFGVFGVKNNTVKTSEVMRYRVKKGTLTEDTKVPDPTPDIYTQLLSEIENLGLALKDTITNAEIDTIMEG